MNPATFDWSLTNAELGRVHGVSRTRIWQLRTIHHRTCKPPKGFKPAATIRETARKYGISTQTALFWFSCGKKKTPPRGRHPMPLPKGFKPSHRAYHTAEAYGVSYTVAKRWHAMAGKPIHGPGYGVPLGVTAGSSPMDVMSAFSVTRQTALKWLRAVSQPETPEAEKRAKPDLCRLERSSH